jgi:Tfp pilus assembly pilus retraction ATPase PilT
MIRKDGKMMPLGHDAAITADDSRQLLTALMPANRIENLNGAGTPTSHTRLPAHARFRCSLHGSQRHGRSFQGLPAEDSYSRPAAISQFILNLCKLNKGLVLLVTGPTGSEVDHSLRHGRLHQPHPRRSYHHNQTLSSFTKTEVPDQPA